MHKQDGRDNPPGNPYERPTPESKPEATPQQDKVSHNAQSGARDDESETTKLERDIKTGEKWLILVNALLLLTTIVIASIYYGQLTQMRKATEATSTAAKAADKAATTAENTFNLNKQYATDTLKEIRRQTKAQQDAAATSRASLESVQRAFVVAREPQTQPITVHSDSGDTTKWEINAVWENAGTTAARRMIQHFEAQILANEPDEGTFKGKIDMIDSAFVGPKVVQSGSPILRDNEFLDVKKRPLRDQQRFLWGWAAYDDVFPKTKIHITEFCYVLSSERQFSSGLIRMEFNNCHKHNCADEECEDYSSMVEMARRFRRKK
jgi:hypothetical protein